MLDLVGFVINLRFVLTCVFSVGTSNEGWVCWQFRLLLFSRRNHFCLWVDCRGFDCLCLLPGWIMI